MHSTWENIHLSLSWLLLETSYVKRTSTWYGSSNSNGVQQNRAVWEAIVLHLLHSIRQIPSGQNLCQLGQQRLQKRRSCSYRSNILNKRLHFASVDPVQIGTYLLLTDISDKGTNSGNSYIRVEQSNHNSISKRCGFHFFVQKCKPYISNIFFFFKIYFFMNVSRIFFRIFF